MAWQGLEAPLLFVQLFNLGLTKTTFLRLERLFFLRNINLGLTKFSLMPRQIHMHIELLLDFINLGLRKCLWPQDAACALYSGLVET